MISLYEFWLAQNIGNQIRECFFLKGLDLDRFEEADREEWKGFAEWLYHSSYFPEWKRNEKRYEDVVKELEKGEIRVVSLLEEDYPERLRQIFDPPFLLYYRGRLPGREERTAAIVGSRKATDYGRYVSYTMGRFLGENGANVISGMALGADTFAHKGALDGKGRTTAVLGSGVDLYTPPSNRPLAEDILERGGCLLSEFPPGTPALPKNYPRRNRIISGLAECVIVVEAAVKSGTSITAALALEQGKDVYAVPGNITNPYSQGTNRLIKDGAIPLLSPEDLLAEMNLFEKKVLSSKTEKNLEAILGKDEREIYQTIAITGEMTFDQICLKSGFSSSKLSGILTVLEIKGMILKKRNKIMIAK